MSKDTKDPHAPAAEAGGRGQRQHRRRHHRLLPLLPRRRRPHVGLRPAPAHRAARSRPTPTSAPPGRVGRQRVARPHLEQGPDVGQARRARHHRPVLATSSARTARASSRRIDQVQDDLRPRQGPHRLEEQPAALPPEREARGRGGAGRLRARRATTRSGSSTTRRSRTRARSAPTATRSGRPDAGVKDMAAYKAGLDSHKWADKVDKDLNDGKAAGRAGDAGVLRQRRLHQRRAAVRQLQEDHRPGARRRPRRRSPRARRSRASTSRCRRRTRRTRPPREDRGRGREGRHHDGVQGPRRAAARCSAARTRSSPSSSSATSSARSAARVEPTLKAVRDKYGDKVRLVWKNEPLPFHPAAEPAAEAAMEVRAEKGDKGFWDVHDTLLRRPEGPDERHRRPTSTRSSRWRPRPGASARQGQGGHRPIRRTRRRSTPTRTSARTSRRAARRTSSSTAAASSARSRRRSSRRSSTRRSRRRRPSSRRARSRARSTTALTKDGKGPPDPEKKDLPKSLPANDPARGNLNAKVTIHEWSDFQCPFCGRVEPTVAQVMKDYGDRIKFVWHDLPLPMHPDAPLAAQAGREAYAQKGPSAFWAMHDKMFANQQKIKRDDLDGYAKDLNLDMDKWKSALDGSTHTSEIEADKKAGNDRRHQRHARVHHRAERREERLLHQRRAGLREVPQAHRARAERGQQVAEHRERWYRGLRSLCGGVPGVRDAIRERSGRHFRPDLFIFRSPTSPRPRESIAMNHRFRFASAASSACSPRAARRLRGATPMASSAALAGATASPVATASPPEDDAGVPIAATDPTWGSRTAPVTIVEFADFQCPFCARAEPTLALVRKTYGPDRVRIVWKNSPLPFHANARPAAEAAAGVHALAGDEPFWRFLELVVPAPRRSRGRRVRRLGRARRACAIRRRSAPGCDRHAWAAKVDADLARGARPRRDRDAHVLRQRHLGRGRASRSTRSRPSSTRRPSRPRRRSPPERPATASTPSCRRRTAPRSRRTTTTTTTSRRTRRRSSRCRSARAPRAARQARRSRSSSSPTTSALTACAPRRPCASSARTTETSCASSSRTSRSPSTPGPSPRPRPRSRCAPRRATRRSGRCTTRCSTRVAT